MVTIEQIEQGVASYLDAELMPNFPADGLQKVLAGTALSIAIRKGGNLMIGLKDNPTIKMLEIMDDQGNIDIDMIKDEFKKNVPDSGFVVELPIFGKMTFHKSDVDTLYKHITGGR